MKRVFAILMLIFYINVSAQEIKIERNISWNKAVKDINGILDELTPVQVFLKTHEKELKLYEIDLDVLTHLDEAINHSDDLSKQLKELRKKLKENSP